VTGRLLRAALWGVCAAGLLAAGAAAHTRSISYSSWTLDEGGAWVSARISLLDLSRLALDPSLDVGSGGRAADHLVRNLRLWVDDAPCVPAGPAEARASAQGWARFRWRIDCDRSGVVTLESAVLLDVAPSHMHFARVAVAGGGAVERVLTEAEPRWSLPHAGSDATAQAAPGGTTLTGYLRLGVDHILTGWDHLAFVIALLLLAGRLSEVAGLVTSFTIAHSVTLALAVLGLVRPDGAAVEALIGYSIALVAAENAWLLGGRGLAVPLVVACGVLGLALLAAAGVGAVSAPTLVGIAIFSLCHFALLDRVDRPARLRAGVAFAFGLVHGFGFAGVLAEMALPTERLAPALFGFNLGVEVGQLAVVALVWPVLLWLERRAAHTWYRGVAEVGSAAVCGLGVYWFVSRTLS
jgi:hypothetical protein